MELFIVALFFSSFFRIHIENIKSLQNLEQTKKQKNKDNKKHDFSVPQKFIHSISFSWVIMIQNSLL